LSPLADRLRPARLLTVTVQSVALGAGVWFLLRTAARSWGTVAVADLKPAWVPIVLGSILTGGTYVYAVFIWFLSLRWWNQHPRFLRAARIWFLSNLARFIPGMVWQFAGLATLARASGISAAAVTAGGLLEQIVLLLTGLVVTVVWAPALLVPWVGPWFTFALAAVGIVALVWVLPSAMPWGQVVLGRVLRRQISWPRPTRTELGLYVASLVVPWVTYGIAFWLFAMGLLGSGAPGFSLAVGAFVASYVAGIIVIFAPSGLVVREAALVAALGPAIGGGPALVLALASRLWLLVVELLTALGVMAGDSILRGA
jgi:hypothetical protein